MLLTSVFWCVWWFCRPFIKGFLRRTTRLCELQRICYGEQRGNRRTNGVEFSLFNSRRPEIAKVVEHLKILSDAGRFVGETCYNTVEFTITCVAQEKNIQLYLHRQFRLSFRTCLLQIFGFRQLLAEVENLRKTPFSSGCKEHEEKLQKLWDLLMPSEALQNRISKQWTQIGFQGEDPKTDFRGMGILGLDNLLYFASEYRTAAQHVLMHSLHPTYGYSFAIVGINLTSMAYHLLQDGLFKSHLYNAVPGRPRMKHFHQIYCYMFYEFDKLWLAEKPRDVMEFNRIRDKFREKMEVVLQSPDVLLKMNIAVETV